jgi:hypothetical protein
MKSWWSSESAKRPFLQVWQQRVVQYIDVLRDISESARKEPLSSEYKPGSLSTDPLIRHRCQPNPRNSAMMIRCGVGRLRGSVMRMHIFPRFGWALSPYSTRLYQRIPLHQKMPGSLSSVPLLSENSGSVRFRTAKKNRCRFEYDATIVAYVLPR